MGTAAAETKTPTQLKMRTAIAGLDADDKPFSWSPDQVLTIGVDVPEPFALALGDGERGVLLDADGNELDPVVTDDRPGSRERGTSRQAERRERPAGAAVGHVEDDESVTGNEVAERTERERLEQLEGEATSPEAADEARAEQQRTSGRRTSRPRKGGGGKGSSE